MNLFFWLLVLKSNKSWFFLKDFYSSADNDGLKGTIDKFLVHKSIKNK